MNASRILAAAALATVSLQIAGCSAAEDAVTGGTSSSGFDAVYTGVIGKNCNGCHGTSAPGYNPGETESSLDFTSADAAYNSLKGQSTGLTGNFAACNGKAFVVAGDASKSLLMASIENATRKAYANGACTSASVSAMESRGGALTAAQVSLVRDWINAGAKR